MPTSEQNHSPQSLPSPGRPSSLTSETVEAICSRISIGESLAEVCRSEGMPNKATVYRWLQQDSDFRDRYTAAREAQMDHFADEILEIADDGTNDWTKRQDGSEAVNTDHIQRSRVRIDTRKWLMARLAPKKYGDRVTNHMVGKDDDSPIETTVVTHEQRARAMALLFARADAQSEGKADG